MRRHPARGVGRRVDDDGAGFGRDRRPQSLKIKLPARAVKAQRHFHRHGTVHRERGGEIRPRRGRHNHLIPRSSHHAHGELQGVHAANGDEKARGRERACPIGIGALIMARHIAGDGLAKFRRAALMGVKGFAFFERLHRRIRNMLRRWQIALAHPERNQAFAVAPVMKHLDNAAFGHAHRLVAEAFEEGRRRFGLCHMFHLRRFRLFLFYKVTVNEKQRDGSIALSFLNRFRFAQFSPSWPADRGFPEAKLPDVAALPGEQRQPQRHRPFSSNSWP